MVGSDAPVAYTLEESAAFSSWLHDLRDTTARKAIAIRLRRLAAGSWGDCSSVGDGVTELRIHLGPGWRVYVTERAGRLIIVLGGGTKRRQNADIAAAKQAAARV